MIERKTGMSVGKMRVEKSNKHDKRREKDFTLGSQCDISHFMSRADEEIYTGTLTKSASADIAHRFDFIEVRNVSVALRVKMVAKDSFEVAGTVDAVVVQACVVTAEPVLENISVHIEERYVPEIDEVVDDEIEINVTAVDVELLENGKIPLGELVQQSIALGVNSHPRKADAPESYQAGPEIKPENPFQKLSELKN